MTARNPKLHHLAATARCLCVNEYKWICAHEQHPAAYGDGKGEKNIILNIHFMNHVQIRNQTRMRVQCADKELWCKIWKMRRTRVWMGVCVCVQPKVVMPLETSGADDKHHCSCQKTPYARENLQEQQHEPQHEYHTLEIHVNFNLNDIVIHMSLTRYGYAVWILFVGAFFRMVTLRYRTRKLIKCILNKI